MPDQNCSSAKIQVSGSCENIANSILSYIQSEDYSLFISSFGPQNATSLYSAGLGQTTDGLDQFYSGTVRAHYGPAGINFLTLNPATNASISNTWKFTNFLNIKNAANRLLALSYQRNMCCLDLDTMRNTDTTTTCGAILADSVNTANNPTALVINENNVKIFLGVNFISKNIVNPFCPATLSNIPTSGEETRANFKIQVLLNSPQGMKSCFAQGTASFGSDTSAPLTILKTESGPGCTGAPGVTNQFSCDASVPVVFRVKTVQETAACLDVDPGSLFLCRIGEKHWVDQNPTHNLQVMNLKPFVKYF